MHINVFVSMLVCTFVWMHICVCLSVCVGVACIRMYINVCMCYQCKYLFICFCVCVCLCIEGLSTHPLPLSGTLGTALDSLAPMRPTFLSLAMHIDTCMLILDKYLNMFIFVHNASIVVLHDNCRFFFYRLRAPSTLSMRMRLFAGRCRGSLFFSPFKFDVNSVFFERG